MSAANTTEESGIRTPFRTTEIDFGRDTRGNWSGKGEVISLVELFYILNTIQTLVKSNN